MPPLSRGFRPLRVAHSLAPSHFQAFRRSQGTHTRVSRNDLFKVSEEVQDALETGKPVVALETTIYTHGEFNSMIFPKHAADRLLRLSLSGKCGSVIPPRISSPSPRRDPSNNWHTKRCRESRHGSRRTHPTGVECWELQYVEDLPQRPGVYHWDGNACDLGIGNTLSDGTRACLVGSLTAERLLQVR
jgi:hypothetical protein